MKINRGMLYEIFTEQHFQREAEKLQKNEKDIPSGFDLRKSSREFSKDLASEMFLHKKTSIQTESFNYVMKIGNDKQKGPFERFFRDKDSRVRLARKGAQIIELDGLCKFSHKSI